MPETHIEALTRRFYDWELRGRGWQSYPYPVSLEPVFRPFPGHFRSAVGIDDGRRPSLLSRFVGRLTKQRQPETNDDELPLPTPEGNVGPWSEWEVLIPEGEKLGSGVAEGWLRATAASTGKLSWEVLCTGGQVSLRLAALASDSDGVVGQLRSFIPAGSSRVPEASVRDLWNATSGTVTAAIEFGLAREFMIPLPDTSRAPHPLIALIGALSGIDDGEFACLQVVLQEARAPWAQNIQRAVTAPDGEPFFFDAPQLTELAEEKCAAPLYAAVLRVCVCCEREERCWTILSALAGSLAQFGSPARNDLVPLASEGTPELIENILNRSSHRSGMILSLPELAGLVRLPDETVKSPHLLRAVPTPELLPEEVRGERGATLGIGKHKGADTTVRISPETRLQHVYVIGASGTGKSTLLEHMILDDIEAGAGVGVLDPHGDLIDSILGRIPDSRIDDVVLFDPADRETTAGWNILAAHSEIEKDLLISDFVGVMRRLVSSWGDQMSVILGNAVMAFLESRRGGTLTDLRQFLLDERYRKNFLSTVSDDHVLSFWRDEWPLLVGKRPQAPILTRLDIFLRSRLVREAVTRQENGLNFREIIDTGKIFLGKLSQGTIGEDNAALLGSLLVSKFHQVSLSRQDTTLESRRPFYLFIDEFQQVVTPSMAGLFSGLRKYRLGVTVAHHDLYQLHANAPEVERAVLTNAYTRVFFRVSDEDARKLERGIGEFSAEDLTGQKRGEAICRIEQRGQAFRLRTQPLPAIAPERAEAQRTKAKAASKDKYGKSQGCDLPPPRGEPSLAPKDMPTTVASKAPRREPVRAPDAPPGKGGPIHKYLQGIISAWAKSAGFRVEVEHSLPSQGRVDIALFRDDFSIACEIAGVTTVEQELGNIRKCVQGGFSRVISVSLDATFLRKVEKAAEEQLSPLERERLTLSTPEELLSILRSYELPAPEKRVAGYRVTVRQAGDDAKDQRQAIADVMLKSLKRMRGKAE